MKILYIANIRIPTEKAHGHQIMKMCEVFSSQKCQVELLAPNRINKNFKNINIFDYYKIKNNFSIKKLSSIDPTILFKAPHGVYIKFQLTFFIISLFFYLLFYKKNKQDIFYTRDEYLLPLLQKFKQRVVWESHALPSNKKRYIKFFKKCYKIIVLTQALKKELIDLGVAEDNILVSPDAVDLDIFDIDMSKSDARAKLNLPDNKIILGYTGTFKTKGMDKGIDDIIKSMKTLSDNIIFVAIGGNEKDIESYNKIATDNNLSDRVILLEKVDQKKLAIYQKAFDVLLMPFPNKKHYAYYMSALKMFEYMAAKRPIVSSDLPSIREVLNENNAVLVKADDPKMLSQGIQALLGDKNFANKISKQAFTDVQKYTWIARVKNIISFIYEK